MDFPTLTATGWTTILGIGVTYVMGAIGMTYVAARFLDWDGDEPGTVFGILGWPITLFILAIKLPIQWTWQLAKEQRDLARNRERNY